MNLSLPEELKRWVDAQVIDGGYGTASEYVRDMLRRARERQARRQVDAALTEAVQAGADVVMDQADWDSIRKAARAKAASAARDRQCQRRSAGRSRSGKT